MRELKETLERVDADLVLVATPIDLGAPAASWTSP